MTGMRRYAVPLIVGLVVVAAFAGAVVVGAQGSTIQPVPYDPKICVDPQFDLNGDGTLDKKDITWWDEHSIGCMDRFGNALPGADCDPKLDVNRDGKVDKEDIAFLYRHLVSCMFAPVFTRPGTP